MRRSLLALPPLLVTFALLILTSGCTDRDSSLGVGFFPDTLQYQTVVRNDTPLVVMSHLLTPTIRTQMGHLYNMTWASPILLVGRVTSPTENLESWGVLRFPVLGGDTVGRILSAKLILKTIGYRYGDTLSTHLDLAVYGEGGGKASDSVTSLTAADLTPTSFGTTVQDVPDTTGRIVTIQLDTSVKKQLSAASFAFVLRPGPTMQNVRGFATTESSDSTNRPVMEYTVRVDTGVRTVDVTPSLDLHVLNDINTPTPPQDFALRGVLGERELVKFNFNRPGDTLRLDQFSTINNAELVLHLDPANSRHSNLGFDTAGPVVALLLSPNDSDAQYQSNGTHDPKDPTIIRFQLRTEIEGWLRNPAQNFGIELRSGLSRRNFSGSSVGVEDNTLNRWTFYGQDASDATKRPQLLLSYSKLK